MEILVIKNNKTLCDIDLSFKALGRNFKEMCVDPRMKSAVVAPFYLAPVNMLPMVKHIFFWTMTIGFTMDTIRVMLKQRDKDLTGKEKTFLQEYLEVLKKYAFSLVFYMFIGYLPTIYDGLSKVSIDAYLRTN